MKKQFVFLALILLVVFGQSAFGQTTTTNLSIAKPQAGQAQPSVTIATGFDYFDVAIAGRLSKDVSGSSDVTLTTAEARNAILEATGTLTGNVNLIVPAKNKIYLVYNNTSGAFTLTVVTPAGVGVDVPQGAHLWVYCDGTDVIDPSGGISGANTTLSNLGTTSINSSLLPQSGKNLGAAATPFKDLYLYGSGTFGSHSWRFTGTPTANRTVTVPDGTFTVAGIALAQTLSNKTIDNSNVFSGYADVTKISTPSNPSAGSIRVFADTASGKLACVDESGADCMPSSGGSGANTSLSNLSAVSVNTALLAASGVDLGSTTKPFRDAYIYGAGTFGTTYLKLTGTPTSTRTVTFPDASITVAGIAIAQTFSNKTIDNSNVFSGYADHTRISAPSNPSAGSLRVFANNATGKLACLDSSGADCMPSAGGSVALSSITDPSGNSTLAMSTNLIAWTWAGNYSTSSAFKLAGNNTSATGPLVEFSSAASNNMSVLLLKPRGGRSFEADKLGSLLLGKDAPGNTDTDGYVYLGVVGSNLFPSGTPTSNTGFAPITVQSDGINDVRSIWLYAGSKWNDIGGVYKRYDTGSGSGAQAIDFNSSSSAVVTRAFTATGAVTFTFNNAPKAGTLVNLILIQNGTGGWSWTFPSSVKFASATAPTWSTGAGKKDTLQLVYDGSNYNAVGYQIDVR